MRQSVVNNVPLTYLPVAGYVPITEPTQSPGRLRCLAHESWMIGVESLGTYCSVAAFLWDWSIQKYIDLHHPSQLYSFPDMVTRSSTCRYQ